MQPNAENSQAALAQLQQTQAQSQNPNDILGAQRQQLGVNAAQDTVGGLRGAINNTTNLLKQVAPSVMGRTQNSLVTNAQATRQIGNESAPLQQSLGEQGQQYNEATSDLDRLESRASQAASGIYQGQQDKVSYLQNLYNTLYGKEQDAVKMAEDTRRYNEELGLKKAAAAAAAAAQRNFDLSRDNATKVAAQSAEDIRNAQLAKQVNTLRQLDNLNLADAIRGLREKARQGDANAKLVGQKYYQILGKPVAFAEFR